MLRRMQHASEAVEKLGPNAYGPGAIHACLRRYAPVFPSVLRDQPPKPKPSLLRRR